MRSIRKAFVAAAALLVALFASTAKAQVVTPVDGLWSMNAVADSSSIRKGAISFTDKVSVELGVATTEVFSKYGFVPGSASILSLSPLLKFDVTYVADKFGSLKCIGTYNGTNRITGTLAWTRADGTVWNYTFEMVRLPANSVVSAD